MSDASSNGICDDEEVSGCLDPGACNFDSSVSVDDGSCDYSTCVGCTDPIANNYDSSATLDDGSCNYPPANVTFQVDMSQYAESYVFDGVYLNGSFNVWCGVCNPMTDDDGNGFDYDPEPVPGTYQYKFTLDGWNYQEEFVPGQSCTSAPKASSGTLTFQADFVLPAFCWESCEGCWMSLVAPSGMLTITIRQHD